MRQITDTIDGLLLTVVALNEVVRLLELLNMSDQLRFTDRFGHRVCSLFSRL